jgi:hypothetical protein
VMRRVAAAAASVDGARRSVMAAGPSGKSEGSCRYATAMIGTGFP